MVNISNCFNQIKDFDPFMMVGKGLANYICRTPLDYKISGIARMAFFSSVIPICMYMTSATLYGFTPLQVFGYVFAITTLIDAISLGIIFSRTL